MIPPEPVQGETAFIFFQMPVADGWEYDEYRRFRFLHLEAYCMGVLNKHRHLNQAVGIGVEPPRHLDEGAGSSEDLFYVGEVDWTPELVKDITDLCQELGVMKDQNLEVFGTQVDEYPDPGPEFNQLRNQPIQLGAPALNRHQRRTMRAKSRRRPR